ncbi:MAG: hypothetical protein A3G81_13680 [Betaproteobacteria bacterium RIFCSPLOWO2_12_FULL_65_14]|nr:MAG: hypothetical protein A3G81_13680 [Betaproteobacteria bacterium RIFCSPLOWO2_12_FULL_65_14]
MDTGILEHSLAETAPKHLARVTLEGLTSVEAEQRLERFGRNAVAEAISPVARALLSKFWGLIPWMLEAAIVVDLALGRWAEAAVIAALLAFNALVGFMQERRTQRALALLRQRLTATARVRRDGRWQTLAASDIVPGDVVRLRVGDVVPADLSLGEGDVLLDQSVLTDGGLEAVLTLPR